MNKSDDDDTGRLLTERFLSLVRERRWRDAAGAAQELSDVLCAMGHIQQAAGVLQFALDMKPDGGAQQQTLSSHERGALMEQLGRVYLRLGQPRDAASSFKEAEKHTRSGRTDPCQLVSLLVNLGSAETLSDDHGSALGSLQRARDAADRGCAPYSYAVSSALGNLYHVQGQK